MSLTNIWGLRAIAFDPGNYVGQSVVSDGCARVALTLITYIRERDTRVPTCARRRRLRANGDGCARMDRTKSGAAQAAPAAPFLPALLFYKNYIAMFAITIFGVVIEKHLD